MNRKPSKKDIKIKQRNAIWDLKQNHDTQKNGVNTYMEEYKRDNHRSGVI